MRLSYVAGCDIDSAVRAEDLTNALALPEDSDIPLTSDHYAIATDAASGRLIGLVGGSRAITTHEAFLLVETVVIASDAKGGRLLRRLLALLVLRLGGLEGIPQAIATRVGDAATARAFLGLSAAFTASVAYPVADGDAVPFATAQLASRIAREIAPRLRYDIATSMLRGARIAFADVGVMQDTRCAATAPDILGRGGVTTHDQYLALVDLRGADETVIVDDARATYRRR